uniref:Uncharacterized protein n=1 Tax=Haptolina brevifila TaxID=156173 RepID=A0A7S2N7R0_9EUKA|mmetsp:Transcript_68943/g.136692  ORF Transcript_68943/g.136692 Transcript_68943/m.136692 type:complete len:103 (+) Transcript_68943:170-478(+)
MPPVPTDQAVRDRSSVYHSVGRTDERRRDFSTSGILSSPHMDSRHLARLTMISRNKKVYKPEAKKLLSRYFQKFSKAGKLDWEESTLGMAIVGAEAELCDEE